MGAWTKLLVWDSISSCEVIWLIEFFLIEKKSSSGGLFIIPISTPHVRSTSLDIATKRWALIQSLRVVNSDSTQNIINLMRPLSKLERKSYESFMIFKPTWTNEKVKKGIIFFFCHPIHPCRCDALIVFRASNNPNPICTELGILPLNAFVQLSFVLGIKVAH